MNRLDFRAGLLFLCILAGVAAAILTARTPRPMAADASPLAFSAGRAMVDDRVIAVTPHPEGSPAAHAARDYILGRMTALGLNPRRVAGEAVEVFPRWRGQIATGGVVENLIGVLPGTDPSAPAILLMAHSDSVPGSPGAADDAAGVISALETVRALSAAGPRKRDVIVLITDGEEAGLLGARAFFASADPLLKHIGMIVNMEARGGGGRVAMFETGADNGAAIDLFAHAVKNTDALSLMSGIYKYLPNSTDFTVSKAAGYPGYNFAFLSEEFDYHSPSSTPAVLDQGSVQHMGDQALALTRALVDAPALPARGADAIYTDLLGGPVIAYSPITGWAILILSGALALFGWVTGARRTGETISFGGVARGAGIGALTLLAGMLVLHTATHLMLGADQFIQGRKMLAAFNGLYAGAALLAVGVAGLIWGAAFEGVRRWTAWGACLAVGLASSLAGFDLYALILGALAAALAASVLGRPLQLWSGWFGVLLVGLLLTLALQILSPPFTIALIIPVAIGALAMAGIAAFGGGRFNGKAGVAIALVAGVAVAVQAGHLATPVFVAVAGLAPEALALTPFLAAFALYPLLSGAGGSVGRAAGAGAAVLGVVVLAVVALRDPATARTPRPVQAFYLDDAAAGQTWRASTLDRLDAWSKATLGPESTITRGDMTPILGKPWRAPTPSAALARPVFSETSTPTPSGRAVTVTIAPNDGGRELRLYLQPTEAITDVRLDGRITELTPNAGRWTQLRWEAPIGPVTLTFQAKGSGSLDLRYEEITDGWPAGVSAPPKPADDMPWGLSDKTVLLDRYEAKW